MNIIEDNHPKLARLINWDSNGTTSYYIKESVISDDQLALLKDETYAANMFFVSLNKFGLKSKFHSNKQESAFTEIYNTIFTHMLNINDTIFGCNVTGRERVQINTFDTGHYFDWHKDDNFFVGRHNEDDDSLIYRKLLGIFFVNDSEEYVGGDIQLRTMDNNPDECIHTVNAQAGSLLVFPALLPHRISPIISGIRKTLVFRLCGPRCQ